MVSTCRGASGVVCHAIRRATENTQHAGPGQATYLQLNDSSVQALLRFCHLIHAAMVVRGCRLDMRAQLADCLNLVLESSLLHLQCGLGGTTRDRDTRAVSGPNSVQDRSAKDSLASREHGGLHIQGRTAVAGANGREGIEGCRLSVHALEMVHVPMSLLE